jgi:hypothetical protein
MIPRVQTLAASDATPKARRHKNGRCFKRIQRGQEMKRRRGLTRGAGGRDANLSSDQQRTDRQRAIRLPSVRVSVGSRRDPATTPAPAAPGAATTTPRGPSGGAGNARGRGGVGAPTSGATGTLPAQAKVPPATAGGATPVDSPRPRRSPGTYGPLPRRRPRRVAPAGSPAAKAPAPSVPPKKATPTKPVTPIPRQGRRRRGRWPGELPSKPRVRKPIQASAGRDKR